MARKKFLFGSSPSPIAGGTVRSADRYMGTLGSLFGMGPGKVSFLNGLGATRRRTANAAKASRTPAQKAVGALRQTGRRARNYGKGDT